MGKIRRIHYARYGQKYPSVTTISIPGTIKYINDFSFNFFPSVEKLYLPAELEKIGWGTFWGMESLKTITLPAGITYIPNENEEEIYFYLLMNNKYLRTTSIKNILKIL